MDRLRILRVLDASPVHLDLHEAILLADRLHAEFQPKPKPKVEAKRSRTLYDVTTLEGRVAYVRDNLPEVMGYIHGDKKIHAIKAMRQAFSEVPTLYQYAGLKECKDVADRLMGDSPYRY